MAEAPVPRLDGAAIQIKNLLYVFAGYGTIDYVHSHVDIYNFTDNTWGGRFDISKEMAHSHLGMATDGRYIYVVTGQYGPQCRGPTARNFVLDTEKKEWHDLPHLPVPRYAPATQLWRCRLHVMGGSKEDHHEPGLEHWSLAVKDGRALEKEWRGEIPIPRGGPHRFVGHLSKKFHLTFNVVITILLSNYQVIEYGLVLFPMISLLSLVVKRVILWSNLDHQFSSVSEEMRVAAAPLKGASISIDQSSQSELQEHVVCSDVYTLDNVMKWKELLTMLKPDSHIEFAWEWSVLGRMPFRIKTTLVGYWNGWFYFTSGQRDKGPNDPAPKKVVGCMWRTELHL
ncbi:hypothetical protein ZIOFF_004999 [Zingiber officinale]|uniref:Kelch repeat-containing protein n=1 Tax=Zingiber officinale TaxID=94328 RepID=A0A8J5LRD8_ZINOF|nr:hypothetical protein ZIOFF_004999 [Zingiber officinale]